MTRRARISGITRSNQYPQVSASGDLQITRLSRDGQFPLPASFVTNQNRNWGQAALNLLSFQVDLWGQLRRATEAARANLLNADWNRKTVITTVVSQVATDYFQLLELDSELRSLKSTLETRQESLKLTLDREAHGIATLLDVRQAEQLVDSAAESIPQLQQQNEQTENQISLLLGKDPGSISERAVSSRRVSGPPEVPAGLPSALLERRPDIRAAEQALIAANANIGVAKAAYFPQISLTGSIGGQSSALAKLFSGPNSGVELRAPSDAADLHRRTAEEQCAAGRGATPGCADRVRKIDQHSLPGGFRRADRASTDAREPGRAAETGNRAAGPQTIGLPSLSKAAWIRNSTHSMQTAICSRPS